MYERLCSFRWNGEGSTCLKIEKSPLWTSTTVDIKIIAIHSALSLNRHGHSSKDCCLSTFAHVCHGTILILKFIACHLQNEAPQRNKKNCSLVVKMN